MSKFAFMVYVETEKTTGLIASRDDQSERIISELENIGSYVDLNGIGARSDSEYDITDVDVWMMDKRDEKEMNAEYEQHVAAEAPTDKELRQELAALRADRDKYKNLYETQKAIVDQLIAGAPNANSRIWQEDAASRREQGDLKNYLADGKHDSVMFQWGDSEFERFEVTLREDKLEVRNTDGGVLVHPMGGNSFTVVPASYSGELRRR
jgi:hypothetical protein